MPRHIGLLAEKSLHAALKQCYTQPGDLVEHSLKNYVVDIVRPAVDLGLPHQCIEIQTRNLAAMKRKLVALLDDYPIRIVYPIAQERYIVRIDRDGVILSRRKSPKRGTIYHLFEELVSLPAFATHPHFALDVALIREEEVWLDDGQGSWRRKHWSIHDRRLLELIQAVSFAAPSDFAALLPVGLPIEFDTGELAVALNLRRHLAQKMVYCLRQMGVLKVIGKRGKALLYQST